MGRWCTTKRLKLLAALFLWVSFISMTIRSALGMAGDYIEEQEAEKLSVGQVISKQKKQIHDLEAALNGASFVEDTDDGWIVHEWRHKSWRYRK